MSLQKQDNKSRYQPSQNKERFQSKIYSHLQSKCQFEKLKTIKVPVWKNTTVTICQQDKLTHLESVCLQTN
ncbi:hypothetical protein AOLI_G00063060 [Acnodon oligacanthus]